MAGKKYYWNSFNSLGSGKKAIKRGDPLPDSYSTDPRLAAWIKDGSVSLDAPSREVEMKATLEELELENMELQDKIENLAKQVQSSANIAVQSRTLRDQNSRLQGKLDQYSIAMMENETKIAEAVVILEKGVLPNVDKAKVVESLKSLEILKEG